MNGDGIVRVYGSETNDILVGEMVEFASSMKGSLHGLGYVSDLIIKLDVGLTKGQCRWNPSSLPMFG